MRRIALIGHDDLLCRRLRAAADGLATVSMLSPATFAGEIAALRPALVLLVLDGDREEGFLADAFATLAARVPDVAVVVLGDARNGGDVLAAVRAGSADFIDRDEPVAATRDHLKRRFATMTEAEQGEPGGLSVVFDARPGGGGGSFALGLAIVRARSGGEVLLIDCALPVSEAGAALDMTLSYSLADAVRDAGRLDRTLLHSALAPHKASGLRVLPLALRANESSGIGADAVLKTVGAVRALASETVLNAAEIRDPAMLVPLAKWASAIFIVCPQKVTALADARDLLDALPAETLSRIVLVADMVDPEITLTPEQMLATLGLGRVVALPDARRDLVNGLNVGRPYLLSNPTSPYALAVEDAANAPHAGQAGATKGLIRSIARRFRGSRT